MKQKCRDAYCLSSDWISLDREICGHCQRICITQITIGGSIPKSKGLPVDKNQERRSIETIYEGRPVLEFIYQREQETRHAYSPYRTILLSRNLITRCMFILE